MCKIFISELSHEVDNCSEKYSHEKQLITHYGYVCSVDGDIFSRSKCSAVVSKQML